MTSSTSPKKDDAAMVPSTVGPVADKKDESVKTAPANNDKK